MNTSMNTSENTTDRTSIGKASIDRASTDKTTSDRMLDQSEIRAMQIAVMLVLSTAYVTDLWQILAFQVGVFFVTILSPTLNPFILFYRMVLRPLKIIKPDWRNDNMEAHRFASIIGLTISSAALFSLYAGHADIGWGLVWLILGFGAFALSGWCAGCFAYYMIQKTGLGGYSLGRYFKHEPIQGAFPGTRPPKQR